MPHDFIFSKSNKNKILFSILEGHGIIFFHRFSHTLVNKLHVLLLKEKNFLFNKKVMDLNSQNEKEV